METNEVMKSLSPKWKRPDEVMKYHRMKQKKRALSARINGNDNVTSMNFSYSSNSEDSTEFPAAKRRNPFAKRLNESATKTPETTDESGVETDISSDTTLFHILSNSQPARITEGTPRSFANILKHLNQTQVVAEKADNSPPKIKQKDGLEIPIDWSIKNKIRFMSSTPFAWSANLKTCEQASSITGFVRCLDTSNIKEQSTSCTLDTSSNAKFHQCCLYWQHPNIPWLQLFPRNISKSNASMVSAQLQMAPILLTEWTTSFKSLFQLVRTRQCPYFYLIANHFYCLFQAAGVAGIYEVHAMITPTTRGFRKMLDEEGVHYSMPLKKKRKSNEFVSDSDSSHLPVENENESDDEDDEEDWMESIGIDPKEMRKITASQKAIERSRETKIDGSDESLLLIEGVNVQAFFNVLLNCKSCVSSTGPFAGIPPTLISPTAFSLATLKSFKVRDSLVHVNGSDFYSVQIEGPILPHAFRQICLLLEENKMKYSASLTTFRNSSGFTRAFKNVQSNDENKSSSSSVFLKENLSDCGLIQTLINVFCEDDPQKKYLAVSRCIAENSAAFRKVPEGSTVFLQGLPAVYFFYTIRLRQFTSEVSLGAFFVGQDRVRQRGKEEDPGGLTGFAPARNLDRVGGGRKKDAENDVKYIYRGREKKGWKLLWRMESPAKERIRNFKVGHDKLFHSFYLTEMVKPRERKSGDLLCRPGSRSAAQNGFDGFSVGGTEFREPGDRAWTRRTAYWNRNLKERFRTCRPIPGGYIARQC